MIVSLDRRVTEPPSRRSAHWELSRAPCRPTGRCPAVRKGKEAVHPQGQDPALRHMVTAAGLLCPRPLGRASLHTRARRGGDRTGSEHSPRVWGSHRQGPGRPGRDAGENPRAAPDTRARSSLSQRLAPAQSSPGAAEMRAHSSPGAAEMPQALCPCVPARPPGPSPPPPLGTCAPAPSLHALTRP